MARFVEVVALDGSVTRHKVVKVRRRQSAYSRLRHSNVSAQDRLLVEANGAKELEVFDQLPAAVRDYMREVMTIDASTVDIMGQWYTASHQGATVEQFLQYLDQLNTYYLNQTRDVWDVPPPVFARTPRPL